MWRNSTKATSGSIVYDTKVATVKNNYVFYLGKDKIDPDSAAYEMLIATKGDSFSATIGVRAVVSLASDIQLDEGTEANTWVITNKEAE